MMESFYEFTKAVVDLMILLRCDQKCETPARNRNPDIILLICALYRVELSRFVHGVVIYFCCLAAECFNGWRQKQK